jgi:hypothetical protein
MGIQLSAVIVLMAIVAGVVLRLLRTDEVFDSITPGLLPAPGEPAKRRRVRRGEAPPIAVRFNPPDEVGPGLAGVAIDGRVDPVELSATLVDLAGRGWLTLHPLTATPGEKPHDWELRQSPTPAQPLSPTEQLLYDAAFEQGPATTLSELRSRTAELSAAAEALHAEAAERNWFQQFPQEIEWVSRTAGPALVLLGLVSWLLGNLVWVGLGLVLGGIAFFLTAPKQLGVPLSAEGSAFRVQAEGFKLYLATAEAEQLRFEVGIDVFSRYLPYAMVFGVVDHWRTVFAEALQLDPTVELTGMSWLVLDDALTGMILIDALTGDFGLFDGFGDFGDFDAGGVLDAGGDAGGDFGDFSGGDNFGDFGGGGDFGDFGGFGD